MIFILRLTLGHVSFQYSEDRRLFRDITASAEAGQRVALIGANGSGKSTLMRILAGDLQPSQGTVNNPFLPSSAYWDPEPDTLSWGQAAWHQISTLLREKPALLLLDEPTRHLDYRRRRQLAAWLARLRETTMVVISHDLDFLDATATHTWHLTSDGLSSFALRPSQYLDQQQTEQLSYGRRYQQQQEIITRLEHDIRDTKEQARRTETGTKDSGQRRYAKKVAKKALSRENRLEHWKESGEMLEAPRDPHVLRYTWDHVRAVQGTLARVEDGVLGWQEPVLRALFLEMKARDRIAVMGDNGSGKSSLLEAMIGRFAGFIEGRWRYPSVPFGYVSQVFDGDPADTTWSYFSRRSELADGMGRAWLQSYGFLEPHLVSSVRDLSHGEQVKLQVAAWSASGVGLLIMDEPEHHLDWPSLDAVSRGLSQYPGTLVVISHQLRFLHSLAVDTLWEVAEGTVQVSPWEKPGKASG